MTSTRILWLLGFALATCAACSPTKPEAEQTAASPSASDSIRKPADSTIVIYNKPVETDKQVLTHIDSVYEGLITGSFNRLLLLTESDDTPCASRLGRRYYYSEFYSNENDISTKAVPRSGRPGDLFSLFLYEAKYQNKYKSDYGVILSKCDSLSILREFGVDNSTYFGSKYLYLKNLSRRDSIKKISLCYRYALGYRQCCCSGCCLELAAPGSYYESEWIEMKPISESSSVYTLPIYLINDSSMNNKVLYSLYKFKYANKYPDYSNFVNKYQKCFAQNTNGGCEVFAKEILIKVEMTVEEDAYYKKRTRIIRQDIGRFCGPSAIVTKTKD